MTIKKYIINKTDEKINKINKIKLQINQVNQRNYITINQFSNNINKGENN